MLVYCRKCGRILNNHRKDMGKCDVCNSRYYPVPSKYWLDGLDFLISEDSEKMLIEECVKSSPEFDEELFNNRDRIRAEKSAEYERKIAIGNAIHQRADSKTAFPNGGQNMPKCPTCGSLSVKPISGAERATSVGFFGLFSKKINKSFKCNNCGYTF